MVALFSLLAIITLSIIAVRIGAIALELTGLSPEVASFQAQSAFSGVGFTTVESETVVNHPVRRRIIRVLVLSGSAGIMSAIAALVLAFAGQTGRHIVLRAEILFAGLVVIFLFARSKYIYKIMKIVITKALEKWTTIRIYDYEQMLGLSKGYTVSKITVKEDSWLSNRRLSELRLEKEGVLVMSIFRRVGEEERYIGLPTGETELKPGDLLICHGRQEVSKALSQRPKGLEGDQDHEKKVKEERNLSRVRKLTGGFD